MKKKNKNIIIGLVILLYVKLITSAAFYVSIIANFNFNNIYALYKLDFFITVMFVILTCIVRFINFDIEE